MLPEPFELKSLLGEGSFGRVYRVYQASPIERDVAVKVLKPGLDTVQVINRFDGERQTLGLLDHANIARVYDAGHTVDGRPFFVMELVDGESLTRFSNRWGLSLRERISLFLRVCEGIRHAHQKGIVHRDIKPSNILVTIPEEGDAVPKVIDFGIAKATSPLMSPRGTMTRGQQMLGTPDYMSPEQAVGDPDIDTRADIYSLGAVLYELLSGVTPFGRRHLSKASLSEIERVVTEEEPNAPSAMLDDSSPVLNDDEAATRETWKSSLRGDLDWIVLKAMEKDRDRRYHTAAGLMNDLQRYLDCLPVEARPPSLTYRTGKMVRRFAMNRIAAGLAFLTFFFLIAGVWGVLWQWHRAQENAKSEYRERQRAEGHLFSLEMKVAENLLQTGKPDEALAYLAQAVRRNPDESLAANRIVSVLTQRNFSLPVFRERNLGGGVVDFAFAADGNSLFLCNRDGEILNYDINARVPSGKKVRFPNVFRLTKSPDEETLMAVSSRKTIRAWDAETLGPIGPEIFFDAAVNFAVFHPTELLSAICLNNGTIEVRNLRTGVLVNRLDHGGWLREAQWDTEGNRIVSCSSTGIAKVWDSDGRELHSLPHKSAVMSASFSPDGKTIVTACYQDYAQMWDAETGEELFEPLHHGRVVAKAYFSPSGSRVLTLSRDRTARFWNRYTGKQVGESLHHPTWVKLARFSKDGGRLLTIGDDDSVFLWDAATGAMLAEPMRHQDRLLLAEFQPGGNGVAAATAGGDLVFWDTGFGGAVPVCLSHRDEVMAVSFDPQSEKVVTASKDGTARVWNAKTGEPLGEPMEHRDWVVGARFDASGERVLTNSLDGTARIYTVGSSTPPIVAEHPLRVTSSAFDGTGDRFVTSSYDGGVRIWDSASGKMLRMMKTEGKVWYADWSPDSQWVVATGTNNSASVWDASSGKVAAGPFAQRRLTYSAAFSPDRKSLVVGSWDAQAVVWDVENATERFRLPHDAAIRFPCFSPDGLTIATGSRDNTVKLWSAETGQLLNAPLRHTAEVSRVRFHPGSKLVVSASKDRSARVWEVGSGEPVTEPYLHEGEVADAAFSPDGRQLATAGSDGVGRLFCLSYFEAKPPVWLPDLAEAVAGKRIEGKSVATVKPDFLFTLRNDIAAIESPKSFEKWAGWFLADRATRTIDPMSELSVSEYVRIALAAGAEANLETALYLDPENVELQVAYCRKLWAVKEPGLEARHKVFNLLGRALRSREDPEIRAFRARVGETLATVDQ